MKVLLFLQKQITAAGGYCPPTQFHGGLYYAMCVRYQTTHGTPNWMFLSSDKVNSPVLDGGKEIEYIQKYMMVTGAKYTQAKQATKLFGHDVQEGEKWLKNSMRGICRPTQARRRQAVFGRVGLVGTIHSKGVGAMAEVLCEISKTALSSPEFAEAVKEVTVGCLHTPMIEVDTESKPDNQQLQPIDIDELTRKTMSKGHTIDKFLEMSSKNIGEKVKISRAIVMRTAHEPNTHIFGFATNDPADIGILPEEGQVMVGKFGALVGLKCLDPSAMNDFELMQFGRLMCRHVIARDPQEVGSEPISSAELESLRAKFAERVAKVEKSKPEMMIMTKVKELNQALVDEDDEEALQEDIRRQRYLFDPARPVAEVLAEKKVVVTDFVRFECTGTVADYDHPEKVHIEQAYPHYGRTVGLGSISDIAGPSKDRY